VVRGTAFAPLRERNFRWYVASEAVNMAGTFMTGVSLAFAVLEVSDQPSALGVVLAASSVPMVLFMLWGGVIADRLPRALVLRAGQVALAVLQGAMALLVLTDTAEIWMMVVIEALAGLSTALVFPAYAGLVPQLVPRDVLQQANALNAVLRNGYRVLGPALGGVLVVTVGPGWALAFDAVTWLVASLLLAPVRIPAAAREERTSTWSDLREGWSLFTGTTWLWVVVLAFGVMNAVSSGAWSTLGPVRADETIGANGWGLVLSAEAVGLLVTSLVFLKVRLERPLLLGMLGMVGYGALFVTYGLSDSLPLLLAVSFLAGAGIEVFGLGWALAMQEHVEDRLLARAYSYDALGSFVAIPVGQLLYGPLGAAFGLARVMVVSGVVYVLIALSTLLSRSVRTLPRAPADDPATS
jgi:MFS family permease